jgi:hypothetical protein
MTEKASKSPDAERRTGRGPAVVAITLMVGIGLGLAAPGLTARLPLRAAPIQAEPQPSFGCAPRVLARLVFGLHGPEGPIPDADWDLFLAEVVTPRFPDGLTVLQARGQWRGASAMVEREPSRVVEIVHGAAPEADERINEIVAVYKARYRQESVMVVRTSVDACF